MLLKVHRCLWSGDFPENSLAAIRECYRAVTAGADVVTTNTPRALAAAGR